MTFNSEAGAHQVLEDYFASADTITVNDTFNPLLRYYRAEVLP
ncbi:MAG: hypothetical protein JWQ71_2482 [Pedosphaera sp.]|nr:hypothetical protein [Pedosphaera sp.]